MQVTPRASASEIASWILAAAALLLVMSGGSLAALYSGLLVYALVHLLATLPFAVRWIDSRDEIFPARVPAHVACEHSDPVHDAVADLAPGSRVLIMSFSHAEDLEVVAACLRRQRLHNDLVFVGLIGSATKWATFRHRLEARGFSADELAQVTCPIGLPGIRGKEPAVIAAAVAAQMVSFATGTQTMGSTVRPSGYCGVTGYKPSYNLMPRRGVWPNAVALVAESWPDKARPTVAGLMGAAINAGILLLSQIAQIWSVTAADWREFGANSFDTIDLEAVAAHFRAQAALMQAPAFQAKQVQP